MSQNLSSAAVVIGAFFLVIRNSGEAQQGHLLLYYNFNQWRWYLVVFVSEYISVSGKSLLKSYELTGQYGKINCLLKIGQ